MIVKLWVLVADKSEIYGYVHVPDAEGVPSVIVHNGSAFVKFPGDGRNGTPLEGYGAAKTYTATEVLRT